MEPTTVTKLLFAWSLPVATALLCSLLVAQTETDARALETAVASSRRAFLHSPSPGDSCFLCPAIPTKTSRL